jgi:hypothetical protein
LVKTAKLIMVFFALFFVTLLVFAAPNKNVSTSFECSNYLSTVVFLGNQDAFSSLLGSGQLAGQNMTLKINNLDIVGSSHLVEFQLLNENDTVVWENNVDLSAVGQSSSNTYRVRLENVITSSGRPLLSNNGSLSGIFTQVDGLYVQIDLDNESTCFDSSTAEDTYECIPGDGKNINVVGTTRLTQNEVTYSKQIDRCVTDDYYAEFYCGASDRVIAVDWWLCKYCLDGETDESDQCLTPLKRVDREDELWEVVERFD